MQAIQAPAEIRIFVEVSAPDIRIRMMHSMFKPVALLGWGPPFRGAAIPKVRHSETARHSKGLSPQKPD